VRENFFGKGAQQFDDSLLSLEHRHESGRFQLDEHTVQQAVDHEAPGLRHD